MPTYEYKCTGCGFKFEQFHAMTAAPVKVCPKCKKLSVKRLISIGAGIIFKGSGFYATDYKKKTPAENSGKKSCSSCSPSSSGCSSCKK
jgi:putative FmdB family regulatory protein